MILLMLRGERADFRFFQGRIIGQPIGGYRFGHYPSNCPVLSILQCHFAMPANVAKRNKILFSHQKREATRNVRRKHVNNRLPLPRTHTARTKHAKYVFVTHEHQTPIRT